MKIESLDDFTRHYVIAAIWSSSDTDTDTGETVNLWDEYDLEDIAPESLEKMYEDCKQFQQENAEWLEIAYEQYSESGAAYHPDAGSPQACAGHDFWLTRNRHGVGFWDRRELELRFGSGKELGDILTDASHQFPEVSLYIGDDGKIYCA